MKKEQIVRKLWVMVKELGTQRAVAEHLGISPVYLHDVLYNRREPGDKILSKLGLQSETIYVAQKDV